MLRRKGSKSDMNQQFQCTIRFLDESEPLQVSFTKEQNGQYLIDHVCEHLNLVEKDYFGLRYVDEDKQRHWLDPLKPALKQLKHVKPVVLCFRVKFYPADPQKMKEEITRYNLFLQLRRDLHHGRLLCSPADNHLLAAYIVQSECGDYHPDDHAEGYVAALKMLPKQTPKMEERISEIHRTLSGQVPAEAEANFLRKAASLETYGVDPHVVKDQTGAAMFLGVTHQGVVTFQGNKRAHLFKWASINKIAFEGKMFILHITLSENDGNIIDEKKTRVGLNRFRKVKKHVVGFKCPTQAACKHLWKCAVEQQAFFTLPSASQAPKIQSGGGLFRRSSKFRFSGRSQREVLATTITRDSPKFTRSASNPTFMRNYSKPGSKPKKSSTFPNHSRTSESMDVETSPERPDLSNVEVVSPTKSEKEADTEEMTIPEEENVTITSDGAPYEPEQSTIVTPEEAEVPEDLDAKIKNAEVELENWRNAGTFNHVGEKPVDEANDIREEVDANVGSFTEEPNVDDLAEDIPVPDVVVKPKSGTSCCKVLTISFVCTFMLLLLAIIFIMEATVENELLDEIRKRNEISEFKVLYYDPVRQAVVENVGVLFKT